MSDPLDEEETLEFEDRLQDEREALRRFREEKQFEQRYINDSIKELRQATKRLASDHEKAQSLLSKLKDKLDEPLPAPVIVEKHVQIEKPAEPEKNHSWTFEVTKWKWNRMKTIQAVRDGEPVYEFEIIRNNDGLVTSIEANKVK